MFIYILPFVVFGVLRWGLLRLSVSKKVRFLSEDEDNLVSETSFLIENLNHEQCPEDYMNIL
jgi:hypothetical protein